MIYCANSWLPHAGTCALTISGISHFASGDVNIKVCDESRGEEPLVAHGLLANHCADARNSPSVQELGAWAPAIEMPILK